VCRKRGNFKGIASYNARDYINIPAVYCVYTVSRKGWKIKGITLQFVRDWNTMYTFLICRKRGKFKGIALRDYINIPTLHTALYNVHVHSVPQGRKIKGITLQYVRDWNTLQCVHFQGVPGMRV
jgi:hypothetical protein